MKLRKDFVTNSSSASFIVESERKSYFPVESDATLIAEQLWKKNVKNNILNIGNLNCQHDFGWDWIKYDRILDKVSYLVLQCQDGGSFSYNEFINFSGEKREYLQKIIDCLNENLFSFIDQRLEGLYSSKGYIDHLSVESLEEIWPKNLKKFLFDINSYIQTANDNYDPFVYEFV